MEEARCNIKLVSASDDITPADADSASRNTKVIDEARRTIPADTMKGLDHYFTTAAYVAVLRVL